MNINIVVAVSENNAIGKDNGLCFHIKEDMRRFRRLTEGKTVVMGWKTYESLPNGALPNRFNIILTRDMDRTIEVKQGCNVVIMNGITEMLEFCRKSGMEEVFVIGGGEIYLQFLRLGLVDKIFLTRIHQHVDDADVFFPNVNFDANWVVDDHEEHDGFEFFDFSRKKFEKVLEDK